ncbi:SNF2 family N-terminal domain-containing protein [Microdochium trichocladiopsis]|uniref:SNF2 family N-terminal domain-containing protein n=1 Tax=Microdochium trichocladiopsis TaxID=1682393 RepID=A0A9P8XSK9_9PEZI|nr:SNF2 family N-terminal domain-containing protein [Microdochium trichocladiopsis]KAH7012215.1 SNF2 family N-terminal domain-containing protein [Microdochium trichocladiopsis]
MRDEDFRPIGCLDQPIATNPTAQFNDTQTWRRVSEDLLPTSISSLLQATNDRPNITTLLKHQWIQLEFFVRQAAKGSFVRFRIYVLPFDVERHGVSDRHDEKLMKAVAMLLQRLNYSSEAWNDASNQQRLPHPLSFTDLPDPLPDDPCLLALFNSVPSPDPDPNSVSDLNARHAMLSILEGNLPGIRTTLYPYQRRSAALMLRRELVPTKVLDPRLRCCQDQSGRPWYYDSATGLVLAKPRYYNGARGGILAEEMGTGKTLICLALISSTKREPTTAPDPFAVEVPRRRYVGNFVDMCAAGVNRHSVPWQPYFTYMNQRLGQDYTRCVEALQRPANRAAYKLGLDVGLTTRRSTRLMRGEPQTRTIFLGSGTLIVVPDNLVTQWKDEILRHTPELEVMTLISRARMPCVEQLLAVDIVLISQSRLERIWAEGKNDKGQVHGIDCELEHIQWKRTIIDEGHKLGKPGESTMSMVLQRLNTSAMWIVTGTPTRNLHGAEVDDTSTRLNDIESQRSDLVHLGRIIAKYLKAPPWAKTKCVDDSIADWKMYVVSPTQHSRCQHHVDTTRATLNSILIRHRLADISTLLPPVDEKIVHIEGSYQDKLALNLFSMMIILNAVQSQRTGVDYLFHPRQRKSLLELVRNLRQACFFGGVFFSREEIQKAVDIAQEFYSCKPVPISAEDEASLCRAIEIGHKALTNDLKNVSNQFNILPVYITHSLEGVRSGPSPDYIEGEAVCVSLDLVYSLQQSGYANFNDPTSISESTATCDNQFQILRIIAQFLGQFQQQAATAWHTKPGWDSNKISNSMSTGTTSITDNVAELQGEDHLHTVPSARKVLASTRIISTASAKLSYLIDAIMQHYEKEQIIIFYDIDSIASHLNSALEVLRIKHLIYTRSGQSPQDRAKCIERFTHDSTNRVLLMDISQAAFGLDMRSASRIYFVSPVLNSQVQAQAIGRARRISQQKPVTVETLVLKGSIEEFIVDRGRNMTHSEQRRTMRSVVEDKPIMDWIKNVEILPMDTDTMGPSPVDLVDHGGELSQTAMLRAPQTVFNVSSVQVTQRDRLIALDTGTRRTTNEEYQVIAPPPGTPDSKSAVRGSGPFKETLNPAREVLSTTEILVMHQGRYIQYVSDVDYVAERPQKRTRFAEVN